MIIYVNIDLKDVFELGRDFIWERPDKCPRCNHYKVWMHGFVEALFDGFDAPLQLKRYRCPCCGCVITLRPDTHFSRIQASKETICSSLSCRIETKQWPLGLSKSRQRHWLNNLKKKTAAYLTNSWDKGLMAAFDYFIKNGQVPVSSTI